MHVTLILFIYVFSVHWCFPSLYTSVCRCQSPGNGVAMWVQGIEPGTSGRAVASTAEPSLILKPDSVCSP